MKKLEYNGQRNICGEHVRLERLKKRISQEKLAARLQVRGVNMEQNAISSIERGDRLVTDYELWAFAVVLEVPMESLINPDHH